MARTAPKYTKLSRMTEEHRLKIANSNVLSALVKHAEGKQEMSASQVSAGLGLLRKVLPDITAVELTGEDGGPVEVTTAIRFVAPGINDGSK